MIDTSTKNGTSQVPDAQVMKGNVIFSPRFDIWENEDELMLYGDLPGVASEDLDIHFEKGELKIFGRVAPRHATYGAAVCRVRCGRLPARLYRFGTD